MSFTHRKSHLSAEMTKAKKIRKLLVKLLNYSLNFQFVPALQLFERFSDVFP